MLYSSSLFFILVRKTEVKESIKKLTEREVMLRASTALCDLPLWLSWQRIQGMGEMRGLGEGGAGGPEIL